MALTLNTGHALYANLRALICVDGGTLKDLVTPARIFATDAAVSFGSGAYGEHVLTSAAGGWNPKGVRFSSAVTNDATTHGETVLIVVNNIPATGGEPYLLDADSFAMNVFAAATPRVVGGFGGSRPIGNLGSHGVYANGAHSIVMTRPSGDVGDASNPKLYIDGTLDVQGTYAYTFYATGSNYWGLGGPGSGNSGNGSASASFVWFVVFDKQLSATEVSDLHATLGASNAFGLVTSSGSTGAATGALAARSLSAAVGYASAGGVGSASGAMSARAVSAIAGYASGGSAGSFQTDILGNNTGSPWANTAIHWTWTASGRIGSMNGRTVTDGTGTTDANGRYLLTSVSAGAGVFMAARWVTNATDDDVYYQAGTVA